LLADAKPSPNWKLGETRILRADVVSRLRLDRIEPQAQHYNFCKNEFSFGASALIISV
jgi:hypothetical protein